MKVRIESSHKLDNGEYVHDVTIDEKRTFKDVPNIHKYKRCSNSQKCKYYKKCCDTDGVIRIFDCRKNLNKLQFIYNLSSTFFALMIFIEIFNKRQTAFFTGLGILFISMVILDIICCIIEYVVPKIRDRYFYSKLVRQEKKNGTKKQKEQTLKRATEAEEKLEEMFLFPYYSDIVKAETLVNNLKKLSEQTNFGINGKAIKDCVQQLSVIIRVLKEDSSNYSIFATLFETEILQFYQMLENYSYLVKVNRCKPRYEKMIEVCCGKVLKSLADKKIQSIINNESAEARFESSAETLRDLYIRKGDK